MGLLPLTIHYDAGLDAVYMNPPYSPKAWSPERLSIVMPVSVGLGNHDNIDVIDVIDSYAAAA